MKKYISAAIIGALSLTAVMSVSAGAILLPVDKIPDQIPAFSTVDLEGNEVTEEIFADKDITMVNVWGTFCSPCVSEMPELGEMARSLPENQQIIGLLIDVTDAEDKTYETAQQIVEKADAGFTHLVAPEDLTDLLYSITGVPTTFFVDKDGNILGNFIEGAAVDLYKERLEEYAKEYPADVSENAQANNEGAAQQADDKTGAQNETAPEADSEAADE